ncbi:MAG: hypothetical protein HXY34_06185 [Candidatus Thorarchaeota archaeon]|nr:hypothetical protein [Candidatus Thorarchaeota archaeon]
MAEKSSRQALVFCERCQQNITLTVTDDDLKRSQGGIFTLLSVHGDPQHALVAYIDSRLMVRDVEYPASLHIRADFAPQPARTQAGEGAIALTSLVDAFGPKRKDGMKALAHCVAQLILGNTVVLVHDDKVVGSSVQVTLKGLLGGQNVSLRLIAHSEVAGQDLAGACVFDLQQVRMMQSGRVLDAKHFEQLIKEALEEDNGLFRLRNNLSKVFYSYGQLKEIMPRVRDKILDTALAKEISIELSLIPLLLEMAESQGYDFKRRVEKDALAHAIRSI